MMCGLFTYCKNLCFGRMQYTSVCNPLSLYLSMPQNETSFKLKMFTIKSPIILLLAISMVNTKGSSDAPALALVLFCRFAYIIILYFITGL